MITGCASPATCSCPPGLRNIDLDIDEETNDDFAHLVISVAFPGRVKLIRERHTYHFQAWRIDKFLHMFLLEKYTVKFILHMMEETFILPTCS